MDVIKPYVSRYSGDLQRPEGFQLSQTHLQTFQTHAGIDIFDLSERFQRDRLSADGNFNDGVGRQPDTFDVNTYDSFVSTNSDLGSLR